MEIKGTSINTTRDFVKTYFPDQYDNWIDALPEKAKALYHSPLINMAGWYPIKDAYIIPIDTMITMFFAGNVITGGEALGRFSADMALKGIYKLYLMVATPQNLMQKASVMFSTFYNHSEIRIVNIGNKSVSMQIMKFDEISPSIEYRIAGWCIRAIELCGGKNVEYKILKSLTKSDTHTDIAFSWS